MTSAFGGEISSTTYLAILSLISGTDNVSSIASIYGIYPEKDNASILSRIITDYLFGCANRFVAAQAESDVHAYEFNENSITISPYVKDCDGKACHGDDLPFTFHTDRQIGIEFTQKQSALSDEMIGCRRPLRGTRISN